MSWGTFPGNRSVTIAIGRLGKHTFGEKHGELRITHAEANHEKWIRKNVDFAFSYVFACECFMRIENSISLLRFWLSRASHGVLRIILPIGFCVNDFKSPHIYFQSLTWFWPQRVLADVITNDNTWDDVINLGPHFSSKCYWYMSNVFTVVSKDADDQLRIEIISQSESSNEFRDFNNNQGLNHDTLLEEIWSIFMDHLVIFNRISTINNKEYFILHFGFWINSYPGNLR